MYKNYFKIAFRNLWRHKGYSSLNIMGLAIGMSAFFLIFLYVSFETSYDNFDTKAGRIYRMVTDLKSSAETLHWPSTAAPMAHAMKEDFPEVGSVVRLNWSGALLRKGNVKFQENQTVYADSTLFSIFDLPLVEGDPGTALKEPLSIVLSQSTAKKYFGDGDPMGQTLDLSDKNLHARVTGVMKDIPENSSIKADLFVSISTMKIFRDSFDVRWGSFNVYSFLLLKPGASASALAAKLPGFIHKHYGDRLKQQQQDYVLSLEPLKDIYLRSKRGGFVRGNINNVYIFSIVGLFILLIACINFINLTTARSVERAKEVGIRKVVGAGRWQLARQFLGESVVICFIAFLLSLLLCGLLLPLFNQLSGKTISTGIFSQPGYILILLLIALGIGLLAGIYPALVLSSFRPITSLKGRFSTGTRGLVLRKGLVIAQFTLSIALIIATVVVYTQLSYMRNQDLGFSKERTLVMDTHKDPHGPALRQEISAIPGIRSTAFSACVPGNGTYSAYSKVENNSGDMQVADLDTYFVDFGYLEQYKMKLLAGRPFSREILTDTTEAMILNEASLRLLGYSSPQAAIGKKFDQWGRKGFIIGVIKDFHFVSLKEEIKPLCMRMEPSECNLLSIQVNSHNLPATIAAIKGKWDQMVPSRPMDYFFLDEAFNEQYRSEEKFGSLFVNFAILAIFISCLGLLGLASYSTLQRTKEVGVRKVMGASTGNIVKLLSIDFLKLVLVASLIAMPLAGYCMHHWLQDFAYRVPLGWWIFAVAGLGSMVIAFATISYQAIAAALANPVRALRSE